MIYIPFPLLLLLNPASTDRSFSLSFGFNLSYLFCFISLWRRCFLDELFLFAFNQGSTGHLMCNVQSM